MILYLLRDSQLRVQLESTVSLEVPQSQTIFSLFRKIFPFGSTTSNRAVKRKNNQSRELHRGCGCAVSKMWKRLNSTEMMLIYARRREEAARSRGGERARAPAIFLKIFATHNQRHAREQSRGRRGERDKRSLAPREYAREIQRYAVALIWGVVVVFVASRVYVILYFSTKSENASKVRLIEFKTREATLRHRRHYWSLHFQFCVSIYIELHIFLRLRVRVPANKKVFEGILINL